MPNLHAFVSRNSRPETTNSVEQEFRFAGAFEVSRKPKSVFCTYDRRLTGSGRSWRCPNSGGTDILISGIGHPVYARRVRRVTTAKKYQRARPPGRSDIDARTYSYLRTKMCERKASNIIAFASVI